MKQPRKSKEYNAPKFQLVRHGESNKVFFVASGPTPGPTSVGATLSSVTNW